MGAWKIIRPEATTNMVSNPSFETGTTGWSTGGTNTLTREADMYFEQGTPPMFGAYAAKLTYQDNNALGIYTFASGILTASTQYTASCWVWLDDAWDGGPIGLNISQFTSATIDTATTTESTADRWTRLEIIFTLDTDVAGEIRVINTSGSPTAGRLIWIDGLQVEQKGYATTYVDGDLPGARWTGTAHGSTSVRDYDDATGGRLLDFEDDFNLPIERVQGFGMPPVELSAQQRALQDGAELTNYRYGPRAMTLAFTNHTATTDATYHSTRLALIQALLHNTGRIFKAPMSRRLRYTGPTTDKEIDVFYDGGLEGDKRSGFVEEMAARFIAYDPNWYGLGLRAVYDADASNTTTLFYIAGREDGAWSALDVGSMSGTTPKPLRMRRGPDGYLYVGGKFTSLDGVTGADNIAYYDGSTWNALGSGLNDLVFDFNWTPGGTLYAVGKFTDGNGYVRSWNGSSWSNVGNPSASTTITDVRAIEIGKESAETIYVGGTFTDMAGTTDASYVAKWSSGGGWQEVDGTGAGNGAVYALEFDREGNLYAGGGYTTIDGNSANNIAKWDGNAWTSVGNGTNTVSSFGAGYQLSLDDLTGDLYMCGEFTEAGGLDLTNRIGRFNGSVWVPLDIELPGSPIVWSVFAERGNVYVGFDTTGSAGHSVLIDDSGTSSGIDYQGTAPAYPRIVFEAENGFGAVRQLHNVTTGANIYLDYDLQTGEKLTVDTAPGQRSAVSDLRGDQSQAILRGSDFANFYLAPALTSFRTNQIYAYVDEASVNNVSVRIEWRDTYVSAD